MGNGASVFQYCAHCKRELQDSVKFLLETLSLFFSVSLFLNCS